MPAQIPSEKRYTVISSFLPISRKRYLAEEKPCSLTIIIMHYSAWGAKCVELSKLY